MDDNHLNSQIDLQQKLAKIGATLCQIRTTKGISLDEVAAKTLIAKRLLLAIEAGNVEELPEPFYTQALIAKFARAIEAEDLEVELDLISSQVTNTSKITASAKTPPQKPGFNFQLNFQLRSLHLYLLYIFLIVVSVRGITNLVERPVAVEPVEEPPSIDTQVAEFDDRASLQPRSTPQFISQAPNSQTVMVGINLEERCWLKVMVDGKIAFEGTLPKGTQRTWTGKEQVTIRAGNAGGVAVTFNNGQKQILGKPGQVEEVTYTVN